MNTYIQECDAYCETLIDQIFENVRKAYENGDEHIEKIGANRYLVRNYFGEYEFEIGTF